MTSMDMQGDSKKQPSSTQKTTYGWDEIQAASLFNRAILDDNPVEPMLVRAYTENLLRFDSPEMIKAVYAELVESRAREHPEWFPAPPWDDEWLIPVPDPEAE